jgi:flagellar motor switch protein FliN/FliY
VTEKAPFFWLRKIASHLQSYDHTPLFGQIAPFDWEAFSKSASERFGVPELTFKPGNQEWKSASELNDGLGSDPIVLPIKVGPLNGSAFWIMPKQSIIKLTSWIINGQTKTRPLSSDVLTTGFYRYLGLQLLDVATQFEPLKKIAPVLSEDAELPETDAFCIDVDMQFGENTCWGRLAIEPSLQKSAETFFSKTDTADILSNAARTAELTLGIKVGSISLQHSEWETLTLGDFIPLDNGGYDPRKHQGAAYITLGDATLFQVKIKQNKIQLIDYAFIYEDPMAENNIPDDEELNLDQEATQLDEAPSQEISLKEMPVNLVVELGRVRITLEKLMQLTPGNFLQIPIHPDQVVKLTVNGQQVGSGELVHLGETLGVRILNISQ